MTLRHLQIFVAVCQEGGTTAAAHKLLLAQSAVSVAISQLEQHYGIRLFDRIAKRLHITQDGERFLQYALHIVQLFEQMEQEVKNMDETGIIRVGTSITIGNCLLGGYIRRFRKAFPNIRVKAVTNNSEYIERCILENRLDLGLIEGLVHSADLMAIPFREDRMSLLCPLGHAFAGRKVEINALRGQSFLVREQGSAGRERVDRMLGAYGIEVDTVMESVSTQAILRGVRAGLGIALLPSLLAQDFLEREEIGEFYLSGISLLRTFHIIYHKNKYLTQGAQAFITLCK